MRSRDYIYEKVVDFDELWLEFKKAIDTENLPNSNMKFKTKRGMIGYIKRLAKKNVGKMISFYFIPEPGIYLKRTVKAELIYPYIQELIVEIK
ncbi:MAG: hypothetical protein ACFFCW_22850 [Candidatus Hodarchaeota archaeon]